MCYNIQKNVPMGDRENKFQKIQISQNKILRMKFYAFFLDQFLWNLKFYFLGLSLEIFLNLLQITNYIYNPWKV